MDYNLIKIILIAIIICLTIFILKYKKIKITSVKIIILVLTVAVLYFALSFLPFGQNSLKFDTIQQSYNYSKHDNIKKMIELDDCVFIISGNSTSTTLHTTTKTKEGWEMIDAAKEGKFYNFNFGDSTTYKNNKIIISGSSLYNKSSDKSIISVSVSYLENKEDCPSIKYKDGSDFIALDNTDNKNRCEYYLTLDGHYPENFSIKLNGEEIAAK